MIVFKFYFVDVACKSVRFNIILVCKIYELAFKVVVASALKTSVCFLNCLLFVIAVNNLCEVVFSFFSFKLAHYRSAFSFSVLECSFCNVVSFNYERFFIFNILAVKICIYNI